MAVVLITAAGAQAQTVTSPGTVTAPGGVTNPGAFGTGTFGNPGAFGNQGNFGNQGTFGNFGNQGSFGNFGNGFTGANGFNFNTPAGTADPRFFDPRGNFFDPRPQFNGGSLGFTPGVTPGNQYIPGSGFGSYYDPYYYNQGGYSGPSMDYWNMLMQQRAYQGGMRRGLAIAGLNSPPLGRSPSRRMTIRDSGSGSGYEQQSRDRADQLARENPGGDLNSTDPQQIRLATHMENVMLNQPLTQGTVVGAQDGGVLVRYEQDGAMKTRRFAGSQVFYFGNSGRLGTAGTTMLQEGSQVLVPLPAASVQQSVAGSRQTYSATAAHKKAVAAAKARKARKR